MNLSVDISLIVETTTTVTETKRETTPRVIQSVATIGNVHISIKLYSAKDRRREIRSARGGKDQKSQELRKTEGRAIRPSLERLCLVRSRTSDVVPLSFNLRPSRPSRPTEKCDCVAYEV